MSAGMFQEASGCLKSRTTQHSIYAKLFLINAFFLCAVSIQDVDNDDPPHLLIVILGNVFLLLSSALFVLATNIKLVS